MVRCVMVAKATAAVQRAAPSLYRTSSVSASLSRQNRPVLAVPRLQRSIASAALASKHSASSTRPLLAPRWSLWSRSVRPITHLQQQSVQASSVAPSVFIPVLFQRAEFSSSGASRSAINITRSFSTKTEPSTVAVPLSAVPLPPNLTIDPRSSFASQYGQSSLSKDAPSSSRRKAMSHRSSISAAPLLSSKEQLLDDEAQDDNDFLYWSEKRDGIVYAKPLPDRLNVEIHTLFTTPSLSSLCGTIILESTVFGLDPIRIDLIKRAVDYYRAKTRGRRKAVTKTISQVSGSGRKIRKQKGGGVARAGHSRPPHFRGGAKAHGPKNVTDYSKTKLNKKVRKLALRHVLSQKLKEGNLLVWNQMHELPTHKTNDLARLLAPWNLGGRTGHSALLLDHYSDPTTTATPNELDPIPTATSHAYVPTNLHVAASNLPRFSVANSLNGANIYRILQHEKLILTLSALAQIEARLKA